VYHKSLAILHYLEQSKTMKKRWPLLLGEIHNHLVLRCQMEKSKMRKWILRLAESRTNLGIRSLRQRKIPKLGENRTSPGSRHLEQKRTLSWSLMLEEYHRNLGSLMRAQNKKRKRKKRLHKMVEQKKERCMS